MWILHIKGPVGRYYKVVDTYIRPPVDLPVDKEDRLNQLKQSLEAQGIEYEVETVKAQIKQTTKRTKAVVTEDKVKLSDNVVTKTETKQSKRTETQAKESSNK